jgi:hypothetical protein
MEDTARRFGGGASARSARVHVAVPLRTSIHRGTGSTANTIRDIRCVQDQVVMELVSRGSRRDAHARAEEQA